MVARVGDTVGVIATTACIRPTARSSAPVLALLAAGLRQCDHVQASRDEMIVLLPEVGSVLVTVATGEIRVCVVARAPLTEATARSIVSREIRRVTGMHAASLLTVTWSNEPMVPMPLR